MSARKSERNRRAFARLVGRVIPHVRFELSPLERRQMLCADHAALLAGADNAVATTTSPIVNDGLLHYDRLPVMMNVKSSDEVVVESALFAASEMTLDSAPTNSAGLPLLHSNPDAFAKLFLDFDGNSQFGRVPWGTDGDANTFSASEQLAITQMWEATSEKYAPFNIDVTTEDPGPRDARHITMVMISRSNNGTGGSASVGGFGAGVGWGVVDAHPFTSNKIVADVIAHEAGHLMQLWHQSLYDANGVKLQEYYSGNQYRAPIMGSPYSGQRALWWNGPSTPGPNVIQDDLAIITGPYNGFGYRGDDHGNTFELADALTLTGGNTVGASGLIEKSTDVDVFSFFADGSPIDITVQPNPYSPMLDATLQLWRWDEDAWTLVSEGATVNQLDEWVSIETGDSAFYRLVVGTQGDYGNSGKYTITGSAGVDSVANLPQATLVTAKPISATQVDVSWLDNSDAEAGYRVERSSNAGASWSVIANLAADTTGYTDATVTAGGQVYYRIVTVGSPFGTSDPSALARADMRLGPTNLSIANVGYTKVTLNWSAVAGAAGYFIEKSLNGGSTWTQIAIAAGNTTSYQVTGLPVDTDVSFRIRTVLDGYTLPGNVASAHTNFLAIPPVPQNLIATALSPYAIQISWDDVAGEDAYAVERSLDGVNWSYGGGAYQDDPQMIDYNYTPDTDFYYRVASVNEAGQSDWSDVALGHTLVLQPPAEAPTNLRIQGHYGSTFDLEWDDNSNMELDYYIERLVEGEWEMYDAVGEESYPFYTTSIPSNETTTFRVRAWNPAGTSDPSNELAITAPPPAPANFTASATTYTAINLSWSDVSGEVGYRVERSPLNQYTWTPLGNVGANVTNFIDTTAAAGTTYMYQVFARNAEWDSEAAIIYSYTTPPGAPAAPASLTAAPSASQRAIVLTWPDVQFETSYKVERSADGVGGWSQIATTGANATTYTNTGLTAGATWFYRVRASNSSGDSGYSPTASSTVQQPTLPAAPTSLIHADSTESEITIEWTDNSSNETGFAIEGLLWDPWDRYWYMGEIDTVPAGETSYTYSGLYAGDAQSFRVRAFNDAGYSAYTNQLDTQTTPAAPYPFSATAPSPTQVNLSWADNGANNGFRIQRSPNGTSSWTTLATVAGDVTSYADTAVTANTKYYYRIFATSTVGDSPASIVINITTPLVAVPSTPTGLTATAPSTSQINLSWTDVATETGYTVQRSSDNVNFSNLGTTGANVTTYADTGLAAGVRWYYRVIATNSAGSSAPSTSANAITIPAAPATLTATPISVTRVDLSWANVTGNAGFKIERSTDGGANWSQIGTTATNVVSYSDTAASAGTSYVYRVKATNGSGDSAASPTASALTVPAAPGGIVADSVSASQIAVSWNDIAGETGYVIERSSDGGANWTQAGTTAAGVTTFNDSGLVAATTYTYRVRAVNATGAGANSVTASVTTRPLAPTGLIASAVSSSQINLTWTAVTGATGGYRVERSANGTSGWAQVGTTASGVTSFSNTGLTANTTYFYRVIAVGVGGVSAASTSTSATTLVAPPAAPSNLLLTVLSRTQIRLNWTDNATNEQGFRIERSLTGTGGWTQVGTTGANVVTFTDSGLTRNTRYYYRVVAYNAGSTSAYSNVATAVTQK